MTPNLVARLSATAYMAYHLRGQAKCPFRPLARITADQSRRVRSMVSYAYRYVPYYRETMDHRGLTPADLQCADDLAKLPLLRREQLQRDPEYFVSTAEPLERCFRLRNSGTMGLPCTLYRDARSVYKDAAYAGRARAVYASYVGRSQGYRKSAIFTHYGTNAVTQAFYRYQTIIPPGVRLHRQQLSLLDPPETNVGLINEFKPDVIHSYGSYLAMLFAYVHATGKPLHRPRALLYTADVLPDSARALIKEEYGIPVFSLYEAAEAFNIGFECTQHTGLHLNIDLHAVRILDANGQTVPDGESGEVVISNLVNRATVLLNYRPGDLAAIVPNRCPCGRSLPLLTQLQGRSDDWIELASGRLIHPQVMPRLFKYEEQIWQWQVVQETRTHFRVALIAAETCNHQETKERVAAEFARSFGEDIEVDIHFVESIERTAAGKVRPVVSMRTKAWLESAAQHAEVE